MKYVQPIGEAADAPYIDADPGAGIEGSTVPAAAIEHPQREIEEVIAGVGIVPSSGDLTQLRQAITKMIQSGQRAVIINNAVFAGAVTGTGKAVYWDSGNSRFDLALADGTAKQNCVGFADVANANVYAFGDAVLFAGLTPGARYYLDGATAGAITVTAPTNAVLVGIAKNATELFVDVDAVVGITQSQGDARYMSIDAMKIMIVEHQAAQGTDAPNTVIGIQQHPLNTVMANTISGASLTSNQITLPAGTYRVRAMAQAFHCNISKIALYNVTDAAYLIQGMPINGENNLADLMAWQLSLSGRFTLTASTVLELRQFSEVASTNGFGKASNSMGVEVYASIEITKE